MSAALLGTVDRVAADPKPYAEQARELLRSTLLDAVGSIIGTQSWAQVSIAGVARAAGVSRQTVYREFSSREEIAQAFVLREVDRFARDVEVAVRSRSDDPTAALAAAFDVFLTAAADDPFVRAVVAGDGGDELLALITTQGKPVLERATERLAAIVRDGWPRIQAPQAELLAEATVRLAISYAALPSGPAQLTSRRVAELLGPYVERALSAG